MQSASSFGIIYIALVWIAASEAIFGINPASMAHTQPTLEENSPKTQQHYLSSAIRCLTVVACAAAVSSCNSPPPIDPSLLVALRTPTTSAMKSRYDSTQQRWQTFDSLHPLTAREAKQCSTCSIISSCEQPTNQPSKPNRRKITRVGTWMSSSNDSSVLFACEQCKPPEWTTSADQLPCNAP